MNSFKNTWKIIPGPFLEDLVLINEILHHLARYINFANITTSVFAIHNLYTISYIRVLCYNTQFWLRYAHTTQIIWRNQNQIDLENSSHQYAGAGEGEICIARPRPRRRSVRCPPQAVGAMQRTSARTSTGVKPAAVTDLRARKADTFPTTLTAPQSLFYLFTPVRLYMLIVFNDWFAYHRTCSFPLLLRLLI